MRISEVAKKLRVHPITLARKARTGKIKATMISRPNGRPYWDITQEALDDYLKQYE